MQQTIIKLHKILTRTQRRNYLLLQCLFCFTGIVQVAGVASLAPFIALLSNRALIHTNPILSHLFQVFGFHDDTTFLIALAAVVMIVIVFSNTLVSVVTWLIFFFSLRLSTELQRSIYRNYLHQNYAFFGRKNSSTLTAVLTQEVPRFIFMVVQPFLNFSSQFFVVLLITCGLIYWDPALAISAIAIIGGGYFLVFRIVKERLAHHGEIIWRTNNAKIKLLNESLGGIKEVKLLGTEALYERGVDQTNREGLHSATAIGLLGDLPKYILESIAFCALLGLAIYMLAAREDANKILAVLSLYAMAGYKLLPAAQAIFKAAAQIKANGSVVHEIFPDAIAGRLVPVETEAKSQEHIQSGEVELSNVSYRYPESESYALKNVSLKISKNSIVALVGTSGAGKSTLADIILGLLHPTEGSLQVGGTVIDEGNVRAWQKSLGYVPQNIFILDDSVAANIAFGTGGEQDSNKIKMAARMANIDKFIESLPGQYSYRVGERGALLSGGQRQRIGIARALYHDTEVLILDEATSALDNLTEKEIMSTVAELKATKTVVLIAHRLTTLRCADKIVFMKDGGILDIGTFDELNERTAEFRTMVQSNLKSEEKADS